MTSGASPRAGVAGSQPGVAGASRVDVASGPRPFVVGLGGTPRPNSSSETAGRLALASAEDAGFETRFWSAREIEFPMYNPERQERLPEAEAFIAAVRRADGLIIASPGYHGGLSGLVKNALDYVEELRDDERPYLHDRAVGCIACASGWQATVTTLMALRSVVHALRGWTTPLGVAMNSSEPLFDAEGTLVNARAAEQLTALAGQVTDFVMSRRTPRPPNRGPHE
jgi:FMN reductase